MVLQQSLECSSSNYLLAGDLFGHSFPPLRPHASILHSHSLIPSLHFIILLILYPRSSHLSISPFSLRVRPPSPSLSLSGAVMVWFTMPGLNNEAAALEKPC